MSDQLESGQSGPLPSVSFDDDGRRTVVLAYPKTIAGEEVAKITFRKPLGKDMRLMGAENGGDVAAITKLASLLSKLPTTAFDSLEIEDYEACMQTAGSWSGKGLAGGQKIGQI